jgi:ankyrin repeat protein
MSSSNPLELVEDDKYEYLFLEEEEDIHSDDTESDSEASISEQNAQDFFYLIRHNKKKYIKNRLNSSIPLKVNTTNNTRITPTMSATIFRRHGILRMLLARSDIRVNSADEHQMSALLYAASNGDQRCLKYLLNAGANPAHANTEGRNVLHLLILRRHFNSVLFLLQFTNQAVLDKILEIINVEDKFGMTPLLYACELGHRNLAKYLIQCGADPKHHDLLGRDALLHAIQSKDLNLVKYFISELNFDVNRVYEKCKGYTPLFYAASADSPDLIMLLLDAGAVINTVDNVLGETPFLHACRLGQINALNTLLYCGADANRQNSNGVSAIMELIKHDLREQLYYIYGVQRGVITPLSPFEPHAIYESTSIIPQAEMYEHLRTLTDKNGFSTLIHAVLGDSTEAVTFLLKDVKCDIHKGDLQKRSPLYHAVANRHVRLFELLIDFGADFNTKDQDNNTVLMHAADSNNVSFVRALIARGADLSIFNRDGWSVLTFTCKVGNFDLFRAIIEEIRRKYPNPAETSPMFSAEHLSLSLNVACVYGNPALNNQNSQRQHASIVGAIVARNQTTAQGVSGIELFRGCQFVNPNQIFPGLEPSIIAAVRNSGDNTTILDFLFQSPNAVNVRITDRAGYTPTLLAVRLQYHNVIRHILQYESSKSATGGPGSQQAPAASAELRCPGGLSPADHACVIRHDKTFTEVRKRARAVVEAKKNKYRVSTGELLALGEFFAKYLDFLYNLKLPFVRYISRGDKVAVVDPITPKDGADANEQVLVELDTIWLSEQESLQIRHGYSIGVSLYSLSIPEQSTYVPRVLNEDGAYVTPLVPKELLDEVDMYTNFIRSAVIVEPLIETANSTRPSRSSDIPTFSPESKSLFYVSIVGAKNLPLLISLLQCNFSRAGKADASIGTGYGSSSSLDSSSTGGATPTTPTPTAVVSPGGVRPGMPVARPGMPVARPGVPVARPGVPMAAARPGMPVARPGVGPGGAVSNTASSAPLGQQTRAINFLRVDNVNNENMSLLEVLFAYAGYEGSSVTGTAFLFNAIIVAKYSPFWDVDYIFVGPSGKFTEKNGKTVKELSEAYNIPHAYELAQTKLSDIEAKAKADKKIQ